LKHFASSRFWQHFDALPTPIQQQARDHYELLKQNPQHPSLHNSNPLKMEHFVAFALVWGIAPLAFQLIRVCSGFGLAVMPTTTNYLPKSAKKLTAR